jgi:hypothetical protein
LFNRAEQLYARKPNPAWDDTSDTKTGIANLAILLATRTLPGSR